MTELNKPSSSLFEVYLRLRLPSSAVSERFLEVEEAEETHPTHITIKPPASDSRKRAVERFAFTRVFEEPSSQLDIFEGTGVLPLIEGVLGTERKEGRDALVATLGVTGSGKSHTILGSKSQRGLIQLTLDVLYRGVGDRLINCYDGTMAFSTLTGADVSESFLTPASRFLENVFGDGVSERGNSRATTPLMVRQLTPNTTQQTDDVFFHTFSNNLYPTLPQTRSHVYNQKDQQQHTNFLSSAKAAFGWTQITKSFANKEHFPNVKDTSFFSNIGKRPIPRPSALPQDPSLADINLSGDTDAEYAIVISMYEVYNDRVFDLLGGSSGLLKHAPQRRRPLLFKSTEMSPDRKVVAGLKKIICESFEEAVMVLETGLMERKVAGTGSNAVSSRSHGFFCIEVKKRNKKSAGPWSSSTMTIVDLAGSERARNARTAGATLAEAGKINESLMYLGQCMQLQSDNQESNKQSIVPYRQCKLTELLFSNSFPSSGSSHHARHNTQRVPQKAIMIVTADAQGDFNATSQILRYSALAREVTVPRIPSTTSTILSGTTAAPRIIGLGASGRTTPSSDELEAAQREIARLTEELEITHFRLAEELQRRHEVEASWKAAEERASEIEEVVRDECWDEMEKRIVEEKERWMGAWEEEAGKNDERLDKKLELLQKNIEVFEDPEPTAEERAQELEEENNRLKMRIDAMERENLGRSPTKKVRALKTKKWGLEDLSLESP
ncbi:MAG: hypothetical protein M1820_009714 [Bogoriella megaspora]|nr:MAG: hypothetical protein M1820_009714 [Bogoriella megaspora]